MTSHHESGLSEAARVARSMFGHSSWRPGQRAAVGAVLDGRDCLLVALLVAATGSGKSLVYQLPAALQGGLTLVVSPLLALQSDQLESLPPGLRARAARLSSAEREADRARTLDRLEAGELLFVVLAPSSWPTSRYAGGSGPRGPLGPWWTKPTACPPGVTTSARTTCGWGSSWLSWASVSHPSSWR